MTQDSLPAELATLPADALADVFRALTTKPVLTLEDVEAATGRDAAELLPILRELARAAYVTRQVASTGSCSGRRDAPSFFFALTPTGRTLAAAFGPAPA